MTISLAILFHKSKEKFEIANEIETPPIFYGIGRHLNKLAYIDSLTGLNCDDNILYYPKMKKI
jgi:hypothetical protein